MTTAETSATAALSDRQSEMPEFSRTYRVRNDDIDRDMRMRLDGVARHVQNVSADMIDSSPLIETDPFWILRRTVIDVLEPITWPADITVTRWCSAIGSRWVTMRQSLTSDPETSPFNPDERAPGSIETESFCIKVTAEGGLSRITDAALDLLGKGVSETRLRWKAINTVPLPEDVGDDSTFAARATDVDQFGHVNNAIHLADRRASTHRSTGTARRTVSGRHRVPAPDPAGYHRRCTQAGERGRADAVDPDRSDDCGRDRLGPPTGRTHRLGDERALLSVFSGSRPPRCGSWPATHRDKLAGIFG